MKTQFLRSNPLILVVIVLFFLASCQKGKLNRETITTADNASAEMFWYDVFMEIDEQVKLHGSLQKTSADSNNVCAATTITSTAGAFPKFLTIDYGTDNCSDFYDVLRRGTIEAQFTDQYFRNGSQVLVTLNGYHRNNNTATNGLTITNMGKNSAGNGVWRLQVTDGIITTVDGYEIQWQGIVEFEWTNGTTDTLHVWNDEYAVTGEYSGVNRDSRFFDVNITDPMDFKKGCPIYRSGELTITPDNLKERTVDYGDGTCDNKVTVHVKNRDNEISVK